MTSGLAALPFKIPSLFIHVQLWSLDASVYCCPSHAMHMHWTEYKIT